MLGLKFDCFEANLKKHKQALGFNLSSLRRESRRSSEKSNWSLLRAS